MNITSYFRQSEEEDQPSTSKTVRLESTSSEGVASSSALNSQIRRNIELGTMSGRRTSLGYNRYVVQKQIPLQECVCSLCKTNNKYNQTAVWSETLCVCLHRDSLCQHTCSSSQQHKTAVELWTEKKARRGGKRKRHSDRNRKCKFLLFGNDYTMK